MPVTRRVSDRYQAGRNEGGTWPEKARRFLNWYMQSRVAQCGDSYFMLTHRNGWYQMKRDPTFEVSNGNMLAAREPSEADGLNGVTRGREETWNGRWQLKLDTPYRFYRSDHWDAWSNYSTTKPFSVRYVGDGEWQTGDNQNSENEFKPVPPVRCQGNDLDPLILQ